MHQNEDQDEQLICPNCGQDAFWIYKNAQTGELRICCINCCEVLV